MSLTTSNTCKSSVFTMTPREALGDASATHNRAPLGPYRRTMPRALWQSLGDWAVSYERGTPVSEF